MRLHSSLVQRLLYQALQGRRYTQDSPVLPEVWLAFGEKPDEPHDLLLTPHLASSPAAVADTLLQRLKDERGLKRWHGWQKRRRAAPDIAFNQSTVVARLWFDEVVRAVLPMTWWWRQEVDEAGLDERLDQVQSPEMRRAVLQVLEGDSSSRLEDVPATVVWMAAVIGTLGLCQRAESRAGDSEDSDGMMREMQDLTEHVDTILATLEEMLQDLIPPPEGRGESAKPAQVWSLNRNRPAHTAVWTSSQCIKADAARRLFHLTSAKIRWAVLDSGVDATHPAFRKRKGDGTPEAEPFVERGGRWRNLTRVVATYDFTRLRHLVRPGGVTEGDLKSAEQRELVEGYRRNPRAAKALRDSLTYGGDIDWAMLQPLLEVPHQNPIRQRGEKAEDADDGQGGYEIPRHSHGTHVAGILAGDWRKDDNPQPPVAVDIQGVCPDIAIYDLRVLDDDGGGDEFSILGALQFVRHLNGNQGLRKVHGINLSLSIYHNVASFACGRTPVCEECERALGAGLVVVAAAGNEGYLQPAAVGAGALANALEGYRDVSITDPGNADGVITVGATHRCEPHTYGVSYFSSRGPTGDGRLKPDLVAPGEKVESAVPGEDLMRMDGTSMAAPHVSGAAALLMARHSELQGQPRRIKQILCDTATDLGRERYFQGHGLVDILRALQSV